MTWAQLVADIPNRGIVFWLKWAQTAADSELRLAADAVRTTPTNELPALYLRIFSQRPFPLDPAPLIVHEEVGEGKIRAAAVSELRQVTHPEVRRFALRSLKLLEQERGDCLHVMSMVMMDLLDRFPVPGINSRALRYVDDRVHGLLSNG